MAIVDLAVVVGSVLLLFTVANSTNAAWRQRDARHLDILALVTALAFLNLAPTGRALPVSARLVVITCLALPYLSLRLVQHFRHVSAVVMRVAVAVIAIGALVLLGWRNALFETKSAAWPYCAAALAVPTLAFGLEARRTSGVTATRLVCASAATGFVALQFLVTAIWALIPFKDPAAVRAGDDVVIPLIRSCQAIAMVGAYLAFAPSRQLRARWQRNEQARYLSDTASRDAEDRGAHAATDLEAAAERSVGHSAVFVALGGGSPTDPLHVRASSLREFQGQAIAHQPRSIIGRVCLTGTPESDRLADAQLPLASLRTLGTRVLVAPIVSAVHTWGVIVVIQRQGSLFPDDDLALLAQFGRHAATALDHAQLVLDAQQRERSLADRRVHEVESLMDLMLASIKDYAIFLLDAEGHVATWHTGADQLFGVTSAAITGEPAGPLYNLSTRDFDGILDESRRLGHAEYEGTCRRGDGGRFVGATTLRPLQGSAGTALGFVAITRDVTEQRELESRLRQTQKMEAIGQLAGGIAHDFNNMLTVIQGYADVLELRMPQNSDDLDSVTGIQKATEQASALTRHLLAFSRRRMLQSTPVVLSRLVGEMMPMLRRVIGERVEIVHHPDADEAAVLGDRSQVEQIILNLAVNARDAMPGGGQLTVRASSTYLNEAAAAGDLTAGPHVLLEVADTGVGMDAITQSRIFEPFFTTKEFGSGTGLGLSTVYGIVRQMGGAIRVESEPQQGTTFRLYFPQTRAREEADARPVHAEPPGGTETLLLVEDEDMVRTLLLSTLKRRGYRVLTAAHPSAAVALLEAHIESIHLLITDVVLPGGSGPELVRTMARLRPGLPALYISGYADAVLEKQGTFPKASQFLQKPFTAAELLTRIRQILDAP